MPESKPRKKGQRHAEAARRERREQQQMVDAEPEPLPIWYKSVMFGLMILGLVWICLYYISQATLPIAALGGWNIMIGFGFAIIGFMMTTRWR